MVALKLYAVTLVVFLAVDAVWLRYVMRPLFERHVGPLLAETPRYEVAAIFYLFYIAGVVWFAGLPGVKAGSVGLAALNGAILGAIAFGTYEATNMATLKGWSWTMFVADIAWGTALTGAAAAVAVWLVRG